MVGRAQETTCTGGRPGGSDQVAGVAEDRVAEDGPQRLGAVVAHVLEQQQAGAGHEFGGADAARRRDQRVVPAVDDEGRHLQPTQPIGTVADARMAAIWRPVPSG